MSQPAYPTRQPITNAGIEAFLASTARTSIPNLKVKSLTPAGEADLVAEMAEAMRNFGEGMTRADLRLLGYSDTEIDLCAEKANARALRLANLN